MCTQTRRAGNEAERRWHVIWTFQACSPDTRWEANFVLDHSKALRLEQGKQQQDCALDSILSVQPGALTYTGEHLSGE